MRKKVIIFDLDGVLADSLDVALNYTLSSHPGLTKEMLDEINSTNFYEGIAKYTHLKKNETEEERKTRQRFYAEEKSQVPLYDGIKELLKSLHELKYILVLNTSARDRDTLLLLEKQNIKSCFDLIGTAELSKSKQEKFKLVKEKYNVEKEDMLFVTDTVGDLREALGEGVPTIAVTWGHHKRDFFESRKTDNLVKIVDTVKELEDFIKQY